MPPTAFQQVGGTLLNELGRSKDEFSLAQFQTNWNKMSDNAKRILFDPKHINDIDEIAGMGKHIGRALTESTTSHSAGLLVMLDIAKDGLELLAKATSHGGLSTGAMVATGVAPALYLTTRWLGNPAAASSMAAWSRARSGYIGHPTPARLAAFNIASRNLTNTLGLPKELGESLTKRIAAPTGGRAEDEQPESRGRVPR
jgi:hypothetical protein